VEGRSFTHSLSHSHTAMFYFYFYCFGEEEDSQKNGASDSQLTQIPSAIKLPLIGMVTNLEGGSRVCFPLFHFFLGGGAFLEKKSQTSEVIIISYSHE